MEIQVEDKYFFDHLIYFNGHDGEIDKLIVDNKNRRIDIYEFKSRWSAAAYDKGKNQLSKARRLFEEIAPEYYIETHLLFAGVNYVGRSRQLTKL